MGALHLLIPTEHPPLIAPKTAPNPEFIIPPPIRLIRLEQPTALPIHQPNPTIQTPNKQSLPIPRPLQTRNRRPNNIRLHPPHPHIIPPNPPIHTPTPNLIPLDNNTTNTIPRLLQHHNRLPTLTPHIPDPYTGVETPAHEHAVTCAEGNGVDARCVSVVPAKAPDRLRGAHVPQEDGAVAAHGGEGRVVG